MDVGVRSLIPIQNAQRHVAAELVRELQHKSWVCIADHGVDESVFRNARAEARSFFEKPVQEKLRSDIRLSRNHRGYVPQTEAGDYDDEGGIRRYEAFDVGRDLSINHPLVRARTPLLGPNFWPATDGFHGATMRCYESLAHLCDVVLELIEIGLDMRPGTISQYRSEPLSQMRYINYFERPSHAPEHVAMGAHTDYEFITIIREWDEGLQVRAPDGRWEKVRPPEGSLVLLAGDLLETVTGGWISSALHRVPDIDGTRFSVPFFAGADYSAVVEPAPEFGASDCEPVAAGPHLLRQLLRDFPYLRAQHALPNEIDLRDGDWKSDFEKRHVLKAT